MKPRKIVPLVVGSQIDPKMSIDEIIRKYKLSSISYSRPPLFSEKGGYVNFLHFLNILPENRKIRRAFAEKWRTKIGEKIWEREFYPGSPGKREYISKLTRAQLIEELSSDHPFLGNLTLPNGETLYLPVFKTNQVDGESGKESKAEEILNWWASSVSNRIDTGNKVTPLIDGEETFREIYEALMGARRYVFLTAWSLYLNFPLLRGSSPDIVMRSTLNAIFRRLASRKVEVYIILWDGNFFTQGPKVSKAKIEESIGLEYSRNVHLVLDEPTPIDSHHQKTIVVDRKVAFCGGFDLSFMFYDRWDTQQHQLRNTRRNLQHTFWLDSLASSDMVAMSPRDGGWHDIHAKVEGPAVAFIDENFRERWGSARKKDRWISDVKRVLPVSLPDPLKSLLIPHKKWPTLPPVPKGTQPRNGPHRAQIVRTMPPKEQSIKEIYLRAIKNARRYIYIENQYFNDPLIRDALKEAIIKAKKRKDKSREDFRVIVVLPVHYEEMADTADPAVLLANTYGPKFFTEVVKWQEVVKAIKSVDDYGMFGLYFLANGVRFGQKQITPAKTSAAKSAGRGVLTSIAIAAPPFALNVFLGNLIIRYFVDRSSSKPPPEKKKIFAHPIYVHAKMMIVDDIWFTIGSANTGVRSFERDTELNVAAMESSIQSIKALDNARRNDPALIPTTAMRLRLRLWAEHLGLDMKSREIRDPIQGADLWKKYATSNTKDPKNAKGHVFLLNDEAKSKMDFTTRLAFNMASPSDEQYVGALGGKEGYELAREYSPHFCFHKQERYFPIAVEPVLDYSTLEFRLWNDATFTMHKGERITGDLLQKCDMEECQLDITRAKKQMQKLQQNQGNRTVYYRAFRQSKHGRTHIIVQYWFFYLDSMSEVTGPDRISQHDGDWEFMQIIFDNRKPLLAKPQTVGCSIHYYGEARNWNDRDVQKEGTHPKIFVARGGHGCHFAEGRIQTYHGMENRFLETSYLGVLGGYDVTGGSVVWKFSKKDYQLVDITPKKWAVWKGHFGEGSPIPIIPGGPRSPKYRSPQKDSNNSKISMWSYPLTWQEEFLKPEYRNIPRFS